MPRHGWARTELRDAALRYAATHRWPVLPGHFLDRHGCSCGDQDCMAAGTHPLEELWPQGASEELRTIRAWWRDDPYAIILPTGWRFDVLDAPGAPGREALVRLDILGYELGPVAQTETGRVHIWVEPGSTLPRSRSAPGTYESVGIRYHGAGGWVAAPPSCGARWLVPPGAAGWHLPRAAELMGTIACACRQAQAMVTPPTLPPQRVGNQLEERLA